MQFVKSAKSGMYTSQTIVQYHSSKQPAQSKSYIGTLAFLKQFYLLQIGIKSLKMYVFYFLISIKTQLLFYLK